MLVRRTWRDYIPAGMDLCTSYLLRNKCSFLRKKNRGFLLLQCLCFTSLLHLPGASEEVAPPVQQCFMVPKKEINVVSDMAKWKRSQVWLWGQGRLASAADLLVAARSGLGTARE